MMQAREPVHHSRFEMSGAAPAERFALWRESISCIFSVSGPDRDQPFHAQLDAYQLGGLFLARTQTVAQRFSRDALTIGRDGMDHYMIQLYETGDQQLHWSGREQYMPNGALVVYDLSRTMTAATNNFTNLSLVIARDRLETLLDAPDDQHMRLLDTGDPLAAMLAGHIALLGRVVGDSRFSADDAFETAILHLVAACLNRYGREDSAGADPVLMVRIRRHINQHLDDPHLDAAEIAEAFGLSRSRLYELFAAHGGVATYIRERRLKTAMGMLCRPAQRQDSVGDIAARLAFSSPSNFTRAFQNRFGITPRAARHYAGRQAATMISGQADRRYERWLHHL